MNAPGDRTARGRLNSFRFAFAGIVELVSTQPNAVIHLLATVLVLALATFLRVERWEWCALAIAMGLVWLAESVNTSIEVLVDGVLPFPHDTARRTKDLAAAGVLFASLTAAAIGLCVFLPHLM